MNLDRFASRRSPVYGRRGMVASSQPLATAAGIRILDRGGGAADAAVAVAAVLNVCEPTSTGLGGDMFALYWKASERRMEALNGSGRAPSALSLDRLAREGFDRALPPFHPYTITVPGACAGWLDLLEAHGRLPLAIVLEAAIVLAEEGFPVAPTTAHFWKRGAERQLAQAANGAELTIGGRGPEAGEIFRNPGLARTLRAIVEGGKTAFYEGEIAEAVAGVVGESGGCLSLEDLASHRSTWHEPLSVTWPGNGRRYRIYECPPNGQGIAALLAFNILSNFDVEALPPLSAERLHLEIEALRLAFADARRYVTDPSFSASLPAGLASAGAPQLDALLSPAYAKERSRLIDSGRANADPVAGTPLASSDTVYFCVVDAGGDACSFANSNYMGFGTGIVPKGFGFSLQNRGYNFSLDPSHPNHLEPGKRPYHTIIPAMITRSGPAPNDNIARDNLACDNNTEELSAAFGVMGGFMQPQGHLQVGLALMEGLDPQSALDQPRFCIDIAGPSVADIRRAAGTGWAAGPVLLEEGIDSLVAARLSEMGHEVRPVAGWGRAAFGRGQVIALQENGVRVGGSDPRADGCAMPQAY